MTFTPLNSSFKGILRMLWLLPVVAASIAEVIAMPGIDHNRVANMLIGTPADKGGAGNLTPEQISTINKWMDNPATKTGQYTNHTTGTSVSPSNHGHLRHNPTNVARAMSGNGSIDQAKLNVARLHKISDVANNTAPVDGHEITPKMRREAQEIINHVKKNGHLPSKLPSWVDNSGPIISGRTSSGIPRASPATSENLLSRPVSNRLALPVKVGMGVFAGRMIVEGGIATVRYLRHDMWKGEYEDELLIITGKAAASGLVSSAVLLCFQNPGTVAIFVVATGVCIIVDITYNIIRDIFDDTDSWTEFYNRLPVELRQGALAERINADPVELFIKDFQRTRSLATSVDSNVPRPGCNSTLLPNCTRIKDCKFGPGHIPPNKKRPAPRQQ